MNDEIVLDDALPRISVICPVFNSITYVKKTVDSLFAQTLLPCELIIVDDGSTDGTPEFLQAYVASLRTRVEFVLLINAHRGPGAARNSGVAHARGDWVAFLDSDDIWLPEKLATMTRYLRQFPEVNFFCHHEEFVRDDDTSSVLAYAQGYQKELPLPVQLYQMNLFSTSAVLCRRQLLKKYGLFDESLMSAQDYELWLRLSPHIHVKFVEEVLGRYIERPGNITSGRVSSRLLNELRIAWRHRVLSSNIGILLRLLRIFFSYGKQYARKWFDQLK